MTPQPSRSIRLEAYRRLRRRRVQFSLGLVLLSTTVLAIGLAGYRQWALPYWRADARQRDQARLAKRIASKLDELPLVIGPWRGEKLRKEDAPLPAEQYDGVLWRRYRHRLDGKEIEVVLVVSRTLQAETLPVSLEPRMQNGLIFSKPAHQDTIELHDKTVDTMAVNGLRLRNKGHIDQVFLRWLHWYEGAWGAPRAPEQYPALDDALVQLALFYERESIHPANFEPSTLRNSWQQEKEFAALLLEQLDQILPKVPLKRVER